MKRRLVNAAIAMVLAMTVLTGCTVNEDRENKVVVATVNGEKITKGDFTPIYEYYAYIYGIDETDTSSTNTETIRELKAQVLDYLVETAIILQQAEAAGITEDDEDILATAQTSVDEQVASLKESAATQAETEAESDASIDVEARTQELLDEYYTTNNMTDASMLQDALDSARYYAFYEKTIGDQTPSDEELQQKYDSLVAEQKAEYDLTPASYATDYAAGSIIAYRPAGYRYVKHILVSFPDDVITELQTLEASEEATDLESWTTRSQEEAAKLQTKITEIQGKITAGESFDNLIQEYSDDEGGKTDEETIANGMLAGEGISLVEPFLTGAMALAKVGDVSEPVISSYGVHLIQYFKDAEQGEVALSEIKDALSAEIKSEKEDELWTTSLAAWKADAEIETHESKL